MPSFSIISEFEKNVSLNAGKAAVVDGNGTVSYLALYNKYLEYKALISRFKIPHRQMRIAIHMTQGVDAYACMLACLSEGAVYAPIDLHVPAERLSKIIHAFLPDLLISQSSKLKFENIHTFSLNNEIQICDFEFTLTKELLDFERNKQAYVIFTSGSTGAPKGVVVGLKGLNKYIQWARSFLNIGQDSRCSQIPNIGFDLSVIDIFSCLCSGATLYPCVSERDRAFPNRFIRDNELTHVIATPSFTDILMNAKRNCLEDLRSLQRIFFCGEPLKAGHVKFLFENASSVVVTNAYGPTEATVSCTALNLRQENFRKYLNKNLISIGKPIEGIKFEVEFVDNENHLGELIIVGEQVALGYISTSPENKQKFFLNSDRERCYRTGDIVEEFNGEYFFIRRVDRQIKLNGFRIELEEIEKVIESILHNVSVKVLLVENKLIAYINSRHEIENITDLIRQKLPSYMLPHQYIYLEHWPTNANGKLDVKKLQEF